MLRPSIVFFLLLCTLQSSHALKPYSATYQATWKASWFPITVEASRTLKHIEDDQWQLSFEAYSSVADLSEISNFKLKEQQLLPDTYRYKTTGFLSKKHRTQEFKWVENKVWLPQRNIWANYELKEGIQDNLSYQEQIRLDLQAGQTTFDYQVTYKNRLKHYFFEVVGESKIKLQQETVNAIEVKQIKLKHPKEAIRIWFAKDYDHLLIKLDRTKKNGNRHTIELKKAHLDGKTLQGF